MPDTPVSLAAGSLDVSQLTASSHPKWWMQDIKSMQLRCTFHLDQSRSFKQETCKELVQVLDKAMRGRVPVRVAPDLNAGFNDKGRATLFFNVNSKNQDSGITLASSLVIFRHDLVDHLTTGFYVPPRISVLPANASVKNLQNTISVDFAQLFSQI